MSSNASELPSRNELPEVLRRLMGAGRFEAVIELMVSLVDRMSERHARALLDLKLALRARYGRRSEKLSEEQLELLAESAAEVLTDGTAGGEEAELTQPHRELDESQPRDPEKRQPERRRGRKPFPSSLPREEIVVEVPVGERSCGSCGKLRAVIGYEESEVLEYIPASFVVKRIRREKRACPECRDAVVCAPAHPKVQERGAYGPGLIAQILVAKFKDHCVPRRHAQLLVSRRSKLCRMDDEGGPLGIGVQAQVPNRLELRGSRARVVSVEGKGATRSRQVWSRETSASEPLMTCREEPHDVETGEGDHPGMSPERTCLLAGRRPA